MTGFAQALHQRRPNALQRLRFYLRPGSRVIPLSRRVGSSIVLGDRFAERESAMLGYASRLRLPRIRPNRDTSFLTWRAVRLAAVRVGSLSMHVILFRHGPAGNPDPERWPSDVDRPLTPKGIVRTRQAARGLKRVCREVEVILSSPYVRALGTAQILGEVLGVTTVETLDALAAGNSSRGVLTAMGRLSTDQHVILVGHEPDLGTLAGSMTGAGSALPLKKAGACAVAFDGSAGTGRGRLLWFLPPRILRRL